MRSRSIGILPGKVLLTVVVRRGPCTTQRAGTCIGPPLAAFINFYSPPQARPVWRTPVDLHASSVLILIRKPAKPTAHHERWFQLPWACGALGQWIGRMDRAIIPWSYTALRPFSQSHD
jgi:hypothetical protein